jgi:hypothetical protein
LVLSGEIEVQHRRVVRKRARSEGK